MKRFAVFVVAALAVMMMLCTADAEDFSGKWINYMMIAAEGDEKMEVNFEEVLGDDFVEEQAGYIEFRDGIIYLLMGGDDEAEELIYKADGDKLVVDLPDEAKEEGISSIELYFEGNDLILAVKLDIGTLTNHYRRPK